MNFLSIPPAPDAPILASHPNGGAPQEGSLGSFVFRFMMTTASRKIDTFAQKSRSRRIPLFSSSPTDALLHHITWCKQPENSHEITKECPLRWLAPTPSTATESEKAEYQALTLTYNVKVCDFHSAYTQAIQDFETTEQTWQTELKKKLSSHTIKSLKHKWPCLSYEEAREQLAEECGREYQQQTNTLNRQIYLALRTLYEEVVPIRNEYRDGIPHPYLDKKIDHALKQAVFHYLSVKSNYNEKVNHVAKNILQNWDQFSIATS